MVADSQGDVLMHEDTNTTAGDAHHVNRDGREQAIEGNQNISCFGGFRAPSSRSALGIHNFIGSTHLSPPPGRGHGVAIDMDKSRCTS